MTVMHGRPTTDAGWGGCATSRLSVTRCLKLLCRFAVRRLRSLWRDCFVNTQARLVHRRGRNASSLTRREKARLTPASSLPYLPSLLILLLARLTACNHTQVSSSRLFLPTRNVTHCYGSAADEPKPSRSPMKMRPTEETQATSETVFFRDATWVQFLFYSGGWVRDKGVACA